MTTTKPSGNTPEKPKTVAPIVPPNTQPNTPDQQTQVAPVANAMNTPEPDAPLSPEAQAEADRIMNSDEGANKPAPDIKQRIGHVTEVTQVEQGQQKELTRNQRGKAAGDKLVKIAQSFPRTTPDEHVVFGFGGIKFTLGDLRDVTGIR